MTDYVGTPEELIEALSSGIKASDFSLSDGSITILFERKEKTGAKSVLSNDEKRKIRELYLSGQYTQAELAKKYHVGRTTITRIVNGK